MTIDFGNLSIPCFNQFFFLQRFRFFLDSVKVQGFCLPCCCHSFLSPFCLRLLPLLSTLHFALVDVAITITFLLLATLHLQMLLTLSPFCMELLLLWCGYVSTVPLLCLHLKDKIAQYYFGFFKMSHCASVFFYFFSFIKDISFWGAFKQVCHLCKILAFVAFRFIFFLAIIVAKLGNIVCVT